MTFRRWIVTDNGPQFAMHVQHALAVKPSKNMVIAVLRSMANAKAVGPD